MLKALIVDDEPLAHDILVNYCENVPYVEVIDQCYSATEALEYLRERQVDLLFLDINMPMLTGLELLKVLKEPPLVVITSAYQDYALESFELEVFDYLLKPFAFERFLQACKKAHNQHLLLKQAYQTPKETPPAPQTLFIKVDREQVQINLGEVSCFEAYGNYVKVWREGKSVLTPSTLTSFEDILPAALFIRIHKSVIVNIEHIESIGTQQVSLKDGNAFNIGKSFKQQLLEHTVNQKKSGL